MDRVLHPDPPATLLRSGLAAARRGAVVSGALLLKAFRVYFAIGVSVSALLAGFAGLLLLTTTTGGRAVAGGLTVNKVFLGIWLVAPFFVLRAWLGEVGLMPLMFEDIAAASP